uniref:B-block binding subunit of TFIIIC domain-containing protein n=1 Tax=Thermofilum pendens TaxID=2269 RepID=A0A7C1P1I3_THEPE
MPSRQRAFAAEEDVERLEEHSVKYEIMEKKLYEAIREAGDTGIMQRDLWKKLGIDSRVGMRILRQLEKQGLVVREEVVHKGRKSYVVRAVERAEDRVEVPHFLEEVPCFLCPSLRRCVYGEIDISGCTKIRRWLDGTSESSPEGFHSSQS